METITDLLKEILEPYTTDCICINYGNENDESCCKCEEKELYIIKVIFSEPATIVLWSDGSKTVVKAQNGEPFDKEKGLAMAFVKKFTGNTGRYNELFKTWCADD